jgi:hypothetical protein
MQYVSWVQMHAWVTRDYLRNQGNSRLHMEVIIAMHDMITSTQEISQVAACCDAPMDTDCGSGMSRATQGANALIHPHNNRSFPHVIFISCGSDTHEAFMRDESCVMNVYQFP